MGTSLKTQLWNLSPVKVRTEAVYHPRFLLKSMVFAVNHLTNRRKCKTEKLYSLDSKTCRWVLFATESVLVLIQNANRKLVPFPALSAERKAKSPNIFTLVFSFIFTKQFSIFNIDEKLNRDLQVNCNLPSNLYLSKFHYTKVVHINFREDTFIIILFSIFQLCSCIFLLKNPSVDIPIAAKNSKHRWWLNDKYISFLKSLEAQEIMKYMLFID